MADGWGGAGAGAGGGGGLGFGGGGVGGGAGGFGFGAAALGLGHQGRGRRLRGSGGGCLDGLAGAGAASLLGAGTLHGRSNRGGALVDPAMVIIVHLVRAGIGDKVLTLDSLGVVHASSLLAVERKGLAGGRHGTAVLVALLGRGGRSTGGGREVAIDRGQAPDLAADVLLESVSGGVESVFFKLRSLPEV